MRWLASCVIATGCGRVGFERVPHDVGQSSADVVPDAAGFGPATLVAVSGAADDDDPSLTADQLELYFASTRAGGMGLDDIWVATRGSVGEPWGVPTLVPSVNSPARDATPDVSPDGLTLWFTSGRMANLDIYRSTRSTRTASWSAPVHVTDLPTTYEEFSAAPDGTGLRIVFASTQVTGSSHELFEAIRPSVGSMFGTPQQLVELGGPSSDAEPHLSVDGLTLCFASNRDGEPDLYCATRPALTSAFDTIVHLAELDVASESDPWLATDGSCIVFSRITLPATQADIYEACR